MAQSVESRALRRSNSVFKKGVDPDNLVTLLYSKELLTREEKSKARQKTLTDDEKLEEIFTFLERRVSAEARVFHELLKALREEPAVKSVADQIQGTYNELKSKEGQEREQAALPTQDSSTAKNGQSSDSDEVIVPGNTVHSPKSMKWVTLLAIGAVLIVVPVLASLDCYQLGTCYSRSLPHVDNFVGREEDIRNITGYLDFDHSNIQVVHIVGPPGFGKSTLAEQIGHIFLRKRVKVHYVDIRAVTDMDAFAERVLINVIESSSRKITLEHLKQWVKKQYSKTLLVIDNCDDMFETHRDDFIESIKKMISSQKSVKYILTSQKWVADVGNYKLHAIYNLSSEAAGELLGIVAPGLTEDQKKQIAELTGNVPLALDVVGAIFKFPNAPSAEEVINGLKDNPMTTLSPSELHTKVDASIGLAYSYLPPELKELCVNLSHFPGSFDKESVIFIFDLNYEESLLDLLVQRSLLQFNRPTKMYHFHQLIRSYFLQIKGQNRELAESYFTSMFQLHFANILNHIVNEEALTILDVEKQNFQYLFILFKTANHTNHTFYAVKVTQNAIDSVLKQRFHPIELCDISQSMLKVMDSYTADEADSQESFFEIYAKVVIQAAKLEKQSHREIDSAIKILSLRKMRIDDGFKNHIISNDIFVKFYSDLAEYYREKGDDRKSAWCHAHILETVHDKNCIPNCNYFDISIAYDNIGDRMQAFQFRELTYEHQLLSLGPMQMAKLYLALYNDYSNALVGNNASKAANFSSIIIERVYDYLIIASESEYLKEVYFDAVDFFRAKNMEDHVITLQVKMQAMVKGKCSLQTHTCANHYYNSALDAWKRNCYHLAINLGKSCLKVIVDPGPVAHMEIYRIIGVSYYYIGNYTDSQNWLKTALNRYHNLSTDLKYNYSLLIGKGLRAGPCFFLILSGDYYNIFCYGYFIKDLMSAVSAEIIKTVCAKYSARSIPWQPPPKPKTVETGVTEVRHSFIWSQFEKRFIKFQTVFEKYISFVKQTINKIDEEMEKSKISFFLTLVILSLLLFLFSSLPYMFSFCGIIFIANVMSVCCTERQIRCCFSCATFCILLGIFSIIAMFFFVLGLDVLY